MPSETIRGLRLLVVLSLALSGCETKPKPAPALAPAPAFDPAAWQFPGASQAATITSTETTANEGGHVRVVDRTPGLVVSTTPEPFAKVYAYYAGKLGVDPTYTPGKIESASVSPPTMTDTRQGLSSIVTGSLIHAGRPGRDKVQTATLVKHDGAGDVVVTLSRGEGEDLTTIEVLSLQRVGR